MLAVGGKKNLQATYAWHLDKTQIRMTKLEKKGNLEIETVQNPGLQYDSKEKKFVAWKGGTDVYIFESGTNNWTRHAAAPTNTANPGHPAENGTYRHFRYSEKLNLHVLLSSVDQDVFVYRMAK